MLSELVSISKKYPEINIFGNFSLGYEVALYRVRLTELRLLSGVYTSEVVVGSLDEIPRICVWSVLNDEVALRGLSSGERGSFSHLRAKLAAGIARYVVNPIQVRTSVMNPNKEPALKDMLTRNEVAYTYQRFGDK